MKDQTRGLLLRGGLGGGLTLATAALLAYASACGTNRVASIAQYGLGEACAADGECRSPMICEQGVCTPPGTIEEGGRCVLTGDCVAGLFCDRGTCRPAGNVPEGGTCWYTRQCQAGLHCAFRGFGGTCATGAPGPAGDLEDRCGSSTECVAGLLCDPIEARCLVAPTEPLGDACTIAFAGDNRGCCESNTSCDNVDERGIICQPLPADPNRGTCLGLGPDDLPIPVWSGARCASSNALDGDFRVLFDIEGMGSEPFYSLPFPNDIRIDTDGTVNLAGHPAPPLRSVPVDLMGRYIDAIEAHQQGFGPNQTVFVRFSGPPLFCSDCGDAGQDPCPTGCMGGRFEPEQTVYVIDLTDGTFRSSFNWFASQGRTRYTCWNWLALWPIWNAPWQPNKTYAVVVHSRVKGDGGETIVQDDDFALMVGSTRPAATRLAQGWDAYQPLRDWLAGAPTWPGTSDPVAAADIAGGTVFTVRDPTMTMQAVADAVASASAPTVSEINDCDRPSPVSACTDDVPTGVREVIGMITLPNYQRGVAPYLDAGGAVVVDSGTAQAQGDTTVRFSLTLPATGSPPSGGWPVVVYAHGTGGDYQSHVRDEVAGLLAAADAGGGTTIRFAVLGIDQVAHGGRAAGSNLEPDLLFFNVANPGAARGNVLQAAADQLSLVRAISAISDAIAADDDNIQNAELDGSQVAFFGHSQGGITGTVGLSLSDTVDAIALSGTGGGLSETLTTKTSPLDVRTLLQVALADPGLSNARHHPALSLIQGFVDEVDPINFARHLSRDPIGSAAAKHVLHVVGAGDTYTPNATAIALGRQIGLEFFDGSSTGLVRSGELVTGDQSANLGGLTRVGSLHAPTGGADGHFVVFDVAKAQTRIGTFFATWVDDNQGVPTVVE